MKTKKMLQRFFALMVCASIAYADEPNAASRELLTLKPNSYRGILSTKRRVSEVNFYVALNPAGEDLQDSKLVISVMDKNNSKVAFAEKTLSAEDITDELAIPVHISSELPAGEYTVTAELCKDGASFDKTKSETKIRIMSHHPAQTIIDDDNTFLVNGTPFFPLGIYHAPPEVYPKLKEIGLNSIQFWQWYAGQDEYGVHTCVAHAMANGLKLLVELSPLQEDIIKENCDTIAKYPAILMWYVLDEPSESRYDLATMINETYHKYDDQHPTYSLSCRPDAFRVQARFGDVFAYDPYGRPGLVADWTQKGVQAVDNRKATIAVLSSFDESMDGLHQPPEEFRANAYTAIVHDARGIFWYPWSQMGGGPIGVGLNKSEALQDTMKQVCSEIKTMTPGLLSTVRRPFKADDSIHAMVCGDQGDQKYLIMVNITDKPVDVKCAVEELASVDKVRIPFVEDKTKDIEIREGLISKLFKPYEVLVYNW